MAHNFILYFLFYKRHVSGHIFINSHYHMSLCSACRSPTLLSSDDSKNIFSALKFYGYYRVNNLNTFAMLNIDFLSFIFAQKIT